MKTLCVLLLLCASAFLPTAEARTYQSIIDELRAETKKGKEHTTALESKIKDLDEYAVVQWRRAEREKAEREELVATVKKLKDRARGEFLRGVGAGLILSVVGIGLYLARRSSVVVVPTPEPDRSIPSAAKPARRKARPTAKKSTK